MLLERPHSVWFDSWRSLSFDFLFVELFADRAKKVHEWLSRKFFIECLSHAIDLQDRAEPGKQLEVLVCCRTDDQKQFVDRFAIR